MAAFYILVMDRYVQQNTHLWIYSASATSLDELQHLPCYKEPPQTIPRNLYEVVENVPRQIAPCTTGVPQSGHILGLEHV